MWRFGGIQLLSTSARQKADDLVSSMLSCARFLLMTLQLVARRSHPVFTIVRAHDLE